MNTHGYRIWNWSKAKNTSTWLQNIHYIHLCHMLSTLGRYCKSWSFPPKPSPNKSPESWPIKKPTGSGICAMGFSNSYTPWRLTWFTWNSASGKGDFELGKLSFSGERVVKLLGVYSFSWGFFRFKKIATTPWFGRFWGSLAPQLVRK